MDELSCKKRETREAEESRVYRRDRDGLPIYKKVYAYIHIYIYVHIVLSLSLFRSLLFFLSLSLRAPVCVWLCTRTRRTGTPTAPGVTQVTHNSSCTHGNRVDSDLSPINKPFRMPTRSARTSAMSK